MSKEKKRVLIIEDEKALQEVLRDRLQEERFEVAQALDGDEGIRKVKEWDPDLVILDIILPHMDGFKVLENLRKSKLPEGPTILVLTNLADEPNLQRIKSFLVGDDQCFVKSDTSMNEVLDIVKELLNA